MDVAALPRLLHSREGNRVVERISSDSVHTGHLADGAPSRHRRPSGRQKIQTTEVMTVFVELTDDLLDLNVTTKGVGNALLASVEEGAGGSSSCTLSSSLCCSFHLCV